MGFETMLVQIAEVRQRHQHDGTKVVRGREIVQPSAEGDEMVADKRGTVQGEPYVEISPDETGN